MGGEDRTIHAIRVGVGELVRYDKAGKWYWEPYGGKREALTLGQAVERAMWCQEIGRILFNQRGGTTFDSRVRQAMTRRGLNNHGN